MGLRGGEPPVLVLLVVVVLVLLVVSVSSLTASAISKDPCDGVLLSGGMTSGRRRGKELFSTNKHSQHLYGKGTKENSEQYRLLLLLY